MHVTVDFETYYNTAEKYSLSAREMSMVKYIHDPRFLVLGACVKIDDQVPVWYSGDNLRKRFEEIDWSKADVISHNSKFDGGILQWKYGVNPRSWIDTIGLAKAVLGPQVKSFHLKDVASHLGLQPKGELKTNGKRTLTPQEEAELAEYCVVDTQIAYDIFIKLKDEFPEQEWVILDWTVRTFLNPVLSINKEICEKVYNDIRSKKDKLFSDLGLTSTQLASNVIFPRLLEAEGVTVPVKKNSKGKTVYALSMQDEAFTNLKHHTKERVRKLYEARVAVKQVLEETRAKKLADIADVSKYCFDVGYSGATQTHRFSGGSGGSGNPQNFNQNTPLREALYVE